MKELIYCQLTNLQAAFSMAYANQTLYENAERLFALHEDNFFKIAGKKEVFYDYEEFRESLQSKEEECEKKEVHIFHTPVLHIEDNQQNAVVTWDSYAYMIDELARNCIVKTTRFYARAIRIHNEWRYYYVKWEDMQRFEAQKYDAEQIIALPKEAGIYKCCCDVNMSAAQYVTLRNLGNIIFIRNWENIEQYFSSNAIIDISGVTNNPIMGKKEIAAFCRSICNYESVHGGRYRCLGLSDAVEICTRSENQAVSERLIQLFEVSFDSENMKQCIHRRICSLKMSFVKKDNQWFIDSMKLCTLYNLPAIYGEGEFYQKMTNPNGNWVKRDYRIASICPEHSFHVENLFAFWPAALRRGELMEFYKERIQNDNKDYYLSLRSKGADTPSFADDESIINKLSGMDQVFIPYQPSYHCASTPVVEVNSSGDQVRAAWIDHSLTNMGQAFGCDAVDGSIPYMIFVSKYDHVFQKRDGKWYLKEFGWEPCLGFPNWRFKPEKSGCWAEGQTEEKYPLPLNLFSIAEYVDA